MTIATFAVILPVRDEENYLERTLDCLIMQTIKPVECILVDDGSTDKTPEIIRKYMGQAPWIKMVQLSDRGTRQRGAGIVHAFYQGFERLEHKDFDFIVKLDGDLVFPSFYFEELLKRFANSPRLGIACGSLYIFKGGRWILDKAPEDRTWGSMKMYRRKCFEDIKGIVPYLGWDAIDDYKAQMNGWQTKTFKDPVVLHGRPVGRRSGWFHAGVEHGHVNYNVGSHPLFVIARGIYRMFVDNPLFFSGAGIIFGYFSDLITHKPRIWDDELVRYIQKKEISRLFFGLIH